jgi:hypothetical protein
MKCLGFVCKRATLRETVYRKIKELPGMHTISEINITGSEIASEILFNKTKKALTKR